MSTTHKPAVSQRAANHDDTQEKNQARAKTGGTSQAAAQSAHLQLQRNAQIGIQQSPYATAQRQQIAALMQPVQRNAEADAPKMDEEEAPSTVQPKAADSVKGLDEEEQVQPAQTKVASATVQREAEAPAKRNDTGLPDNLKSGIESLSGMSMDSVKVHYNSEKPAQLNALAYAQGTDIHVAPGQEQHLPHEAWHVVQQAQGRVQPTMQMKEGVPVNDDLGLEHEADVMGARALAVAQQVADPAAMESGSANSLLPIQQVVQRMSLNGVLVNEAIAYPNDNEGAVLTHMVGEWDVAGGLAVTGGHLLTAMVAQWGAAVANSNPNAASPTGVHFAGGLPGNNITPHQHSFRLVANNPAHQGQRRVSNLKQSTFWPANWGDANLVLTLNNSWRNGAANEWASKANMSYWYRWQTLGDNTLFPIERVAEAEGTLRNRMRAGRPARMRAAPELQHGDVTLARHPQPVQRHVPTADLPPIAKGHDVVQRHISWDANQFVIDNTRPKWMGTVANLPVGVLQSKNHIVPFAGIQNDLCVLLNQLLGNPAMVAHQNEVITLCESLYPTQPPPDYAKMVNRRNACINAIVNGNNGLYHQESRALLSALNSSPDNIRAGDATNNLRIGENLDADFNAGPMPYNGNVIRNGAQVAINQNVLTLVAASNDVIYRYFHQQEQSNAIQGGFGLTFVLSWLTGRQISSGAGPTAGGGVFGGAALPVLVTPPAGAAADPYLFQ